MFVIVLAGCTRGPAQPEFAPLSPVNGIVTQGGRPVAGGVVQFAPVVDPQQFMINSEVGPDGKFNLTTVRTTDTRGERKPGAPAGNYRVTYQAPVLDQTSGNVGPVTLPQEVAIASGPNDLVIALP